MAERDEAPGTGGADADGPPRVDDTAGAGGSGDAVPLPGEAGTESLPEMKPIPPEMYRGPGGCGFTGCMYAIMIFAVVALVLLVIGLLTREWMVPGVPPR
jgi:hypothetical protein